MAQLLLLARHPADLVKSLISIIGLRTTAHTHAVPRSGLKYVGNYLSRNMTSRDRLNAIKFHYEFLQVNMPYALLKPERMLWNVKDDEDKLHEVVVRTSELAPMEGEVEVVYRLDGKRLCTLTFSIIHGLVVGTCDSAILFIGGLQGAYWTREEVRYAARKNNEIAPMTMLVLAARATADALGIDVVVGTSSEVQVAGLYKVDGRSTSFDYDGLWHLSGGTRNALGYFVLPAADSIHVDDPVTGKHRARTRRRRKSRADIRATMFDALVGIVKTSGILAATIAVSETTDWTSLASKPLLLKQIA